MQHEMVCALREDDRIGHGESVDFDDVKLILRCAKDVGAVGL